MERIKASSDKWFNNLTGPQQESIEDITGSKYHRQLNRMLYDSEYVPKNKEVLENMANVLDSSLSKFELEDSIVTYRGMSMEEFDNLISGNEFKEFKHLSIVERVANNFVDNYNDEGIVVKFYLPKGTNGAFIGDYSRFHHEQEFILNRNTKYKHSINSQNQVEVYILVE